MAVCILIKEGRVMTEEAREAGIDKFYGLREVAEESRALRGSNATNHYTPPAGHKWSLLQCWSKWTHDSKSMLKPSKVQYLMLDFFG